MHDLVQFVQFEMREKHPWKSITPIKVAGLTLFKLCECCFYQIAQSVSNKECKEVIIFPILDKNYGDLRAKKMSKISFWLSNFNKRNSRECDLIDVSSI